jgi:hypothetical protein
MAKAKKTTKAKKTEEKGTLEGNRFPGLGSLDGEPIAKFIASVEDAFHALGQPGFGPAGDESPEAPVSRERFEEWATSVGERFEFMGQTPLPNNLGSPAGARVDETALRDWTQRVWARFAALGVTLPDPPEPLSDDDVI